MRTKIVIGTLVGIIVVLVGVLFVTWMSDRKDTSRRSILYDFDEADVDRLNEMVHRHANRKGDYLMLIPPIIDGGYSIHDVHSNGRVITWTIDNSRDGMSSERDRGKQTFNCLGISLHTDKEFYKYTLDECYDGYEGSFTVFSIRKDEVLRRSVNKLGFNRFFD
ncbi:hypothetical protein SY83_03460 [Paenibacillus swuensis]|uniref:DUF4362 domain-containing protein n=1 Tax=Paenibacillus swuensis TaxID=1178515 RepID=A0A172TEN5_9BACL|nr:DUF4362 domain-containing protein [Paenibacillus swuensis]ANE45525.1 hypothetical protein SY83_03460 [Paenibacillus swuensis]